MNIAKDSVVTLRFTLTDEQGELLEASDPDISYLHGGYDNIFPLVEETLEGKPVGHVCSVTLTPQEGFGDYDPSLKRVEPADIFPAKVRVGMKFEGQAEGPGHQESIIYTVMEVNGDQVVVDGNHPLAGKTLVFECTVLGVRPATGDEMEHGHVHGDHGHHH